MTQMLVRAVIWDMDGVIVDTGDYHYRSWRDTFKTEGKDFTEKDFQAVFGQRNDAIIRQTLGQALPQSRVDRLADEKDSLFRRTVKSHIKPFAGVITLLKTLKANGILAAVASSAPLENIQLILRETGTDEYFQALVYGREVAEGKPSPQIYLLAARKLGAEPANCIVIEDAVAGVEGAKRAGMRCIAVTNTHEAGGLDQADLVVDSLERVGINEIKQLFKMKA